MGIDTRGAVNKVVAERPPARCGPGLGRRALLSHGRPLLKSRIHEHEIGHNASADAFEASDKVSEVTVANRAILIDR